MFYEQSQDWYKSLKNVETEARVDKLEVEGDVRACSHQEVQDLTLVNVRHLQKIDDTEDYAFIQKSFLNLRELKYDRDESS